MRVRATAACLVALALAGCAHKSAGSGEIPQSSTAVATAAAAPLRTCGSVPVATGTTSRVVGVTVTGPASALAGSQLDLNVRWRSLDGKPHVFDADSPVVLVAQGQHVVGEYEGAIAASLSEIHVTAGAPTTMRASVLLSGCPRRPVDVSAPDLTRHQLPPGSYQIVVSAASHGDTLVTEPMPLQVTADPTMPPTCGEVPVSDGPSSDTVGAQLITAATARAGSTVAVQVLLRSMRGKAEPFSSSVPAQLLVVRNGFVVGRSDGALGGGGRDVTVPASGTQPFLDPPSPGSDITLSGCPVGPNPSQASPSPRRPLPAGAYQLVAVLDDLAPGHQGALVAEPATIQVTAG